MNMHFWIGVVALLLGGWGLIQLVFMRGRRLRGLAFLIVGFFALGAVADAEKEQAATDGGFESVTEYDEAQKFGISDAKAWAEQRDELRAKAAAEANEREALELAAKDAGFPSVELYAKAKDVGISSFALWKAHEHQVEIDAAIAKGGFPDAVSYRQAKELGVTTFAALKAKKAELVYRKVAIDDLKLDIDDMVGKRIRVRGRGTLLGETLILADRRQTFDTNGIPVRIDKLPRKTRKWLLNKCNLSCRITVEGEVGRFVLALSNGIVAHRILR